MLDHSKEVLTDYFVTYVGVSEQNARVLAYCVGAALIVLVAFLALSLCRLLLLSVVSRVIKKTHNTWDDALLETRFPKRDVHVIPIF